MLTEAWSQLRYHPEQTKLWRTKARYVAVAAGRGSGKTELSRRRVVRYLSVKKPWPNPMYFYALPTASQAKRVAWRPLKELVPPSWIRRCNNSEMFIETVFGSTLHVLGMDKPHRAEGVQWDGGIVDESCDQKPGMFDLTLLPMFSHRKAWCWRIGVPKRYGVGAHEFKTIWEEWVKPNDLHTAAFTWMSSEILTSKEVEWARNNLDPRDYAEQYEASWQEASGSIFYAFEETANVSRDVVYLPELPIVVGSDFNVDPMAWVLCHVIDNELHCFDELFLRNSNTQRTLNELYKRYGQHSAGWLFYGDATGQARKTAAAETDYLQIRNDNRFESRRILYPKANPRTANRFAACNAMFCNAMGRRRFKVHPKCQNLIVDIQSRSYRAGTREPDDYGDLGHMSDALGYIIYARFPITATPIKTVLPVHTRAI